MRFWLIDVPAFLLDTGIRLYWYFIGIVGIICVLTAASWALLWALGYSLP